MADNWLTKYVIECERPLTRHVSKLHLLFWVDVFESASDAPNIGSVMFVIIPHLFYHVF